MSPAALRRILHASSASVLLLAYFGSVGVLRFALTSTAALALLLDLLRVKRPALGRFLADFVPVFRAAESTRLCGATWLCLGYALAAWFPAPGPTAGILVGAFADPAASLVGSKFGEESLPKTWAGSAAAAAVAALALLVLGIPLYAIIAGAVTALALERWPGPLNDNLVLPPGAALVVVLLA